MPTIEARGNISLSLSLLTEQERVVAEVARRLSVIEELETVTTANLPRATCSRSYSGLSQFAR